jgi:hypothetical protein
MLAQLLQQQKHLLVVKGQYKEKCSKEIGLALDNPTKCSKELELVQKII